MAENTVTVSNSEPSYYCCNCRQLTFVRLVENDTLSCRYCLSKRIKVFDELLHVGDDASDRKTLLSENVPKSKRDQVCFRRREFDISQTRNCDRNQNPNGNQGNESNKENTSNSDQTYNQPALSPSLFSSFRLRRYISWSPNSQNLGPNFSASTSLASSQSSDSTTNRSQAGIGTGGQDQGQGQSKQNAFSNQHVLRLKSHVDMDSLEDLWTAVSTKSSSCSMPPPLSAERILRLKRIHFSENQCQGKDKNEQSQSHCKMCNEDFKLADKMIRLSCEHIFHENCLLTWLQISGSCPHCRKDLTKTKEKTSSKWWPRFWN